MDQLFDEEASILREQTHRAEQAELAVRLQQIRAAQAEARAVAAVSSEAVAQESLSEAVVVWCYVVAWLLVIIICSECPPRFVRLL